MAGFDKKFTASPVGKFTALAERLFGIQLGKVAVETTEKIEKPMHPGGTDPFIDLIDDPAIVIDGESFYEYHVRTNVIRLGEMGMQPEEMRVVIGEKIWDYLAAKDEAAAKVSALEDNK